MYCSNCGKSIAGNLNYCNSCGAPTENNLVVRQRMSPSGLFTISGTFIMVVGLLALFPVVRSILDNPIDTSAKVLLILAYLFTLLLMFAATMMMAWKQLSIANANKRAGNEQDAYRSPATFRGVNTSQLPEGDPGFGSVTDSTTRTLDEVTIERS